MIDWKNAPEWATHYGTHEILSHDGFFRLDGHSLYFWQDDKWKIYNCEKSYNWTVTLLNTLTPRPIEWPTEERIDVIGQQGNTGEHYAAVPDWSKAPEWADRWAIVTTYGAPVWYNATKWQYAAGGDERRIADCGFGELDFKTIHVRPGTNRKESAPNPLARPAAADFVKRAVEKEVLRLRGKSIALTGTFTKISREEAKRRLEQLGATIVGSVSVNTDMVFAGVDYGSKVDKANELGVKVRTERELVDLLTLPATDAPRNKYDRVIYGKYGTGSTIVDVYRVLNAFGPLSPEIDHSIKKLLAAGQRGVKDEKQDLIEAIQSIEARLQYLEATSG